MIAKKLLLAASASIPSHLVGHYLPDIPSSWSEEDICVMDGNAALVKEVSRRWPGVKRVSGKSVVGFRKLLEDTSHLVLLWDGDNLNRLLFEARLLGVPSKVVPVQVTKVVNKRTTDSYDVYIGRGTPWGNPFAIGHGDGPDRAEVIEKYKEYFNDKLNSDPAFKRGILGLRGLRLACFCKPQACHGDVIAAYLDQLPSDLTGEEDLRVSSHLTEN